MSEQIKPINIDNIEDQIFLHDCYVNLFGNINTIKQLQLFTIYNYAVDFTGNQWFLYKPKYSSFPKTISNKEMAIGDFENVKSSQQIKEFDNVSGEIWVRLNSFPFAYPISYNTHCLIKERIWKSALLAEHIKFNIAGNFGYLYYKESDSYNIIFFSIGETSVNLSNDIDLTTDSIAQYIDGNKIRFHKAKENEAEKVMPLLKKSILINPIKTFKFKDTEVFIDCVHSNGSFYIFYYDTQTINNDNSIRMTKVDNIEYKSISDYIAPTSIVNLPNYNINEKNICSPNINPNWAISVSSDNINIAYESIQS